MDVAARRPLFSGWVTFWFAPAKPIGLHRLRFLAGLLFLCWLLPLAGHVEEFFGATGWFDATAYSEARALRNGPPEPFGWSVLDLVRGNPALLNATFWTTIVIFLAFTLGICARLTALLSWLMVVSFLATPAASYDADYLVALIAFYMMVGYVLLGQWSRELSTAERILGPRDVGLLAWFSGTKSSEMAPSYAANVAVRLLQVHFAIAVVTSGLHKLQFGDWWSGVAFWYPLHPPFETGMDTIEAEAAAGSTDTRLFMMSLGAYLALAWQIGFPLFAWRKAWRIVLIGGALVGWMGCAFLYKLPYFGPIYLIGCLSYLTPEEWIGLGRWTARFRAGAPVIEEKSTRFRARVSKHV